MQARPTPAVGKVRFTHENQASVVFRAQGSTGGVESRGPVATLPYEAIRDAMDRGGVNAMNVSRNGMTVQVRFFHHDEDNQTELSSLPPKERHAYRIRKVPEVVESKGIVHIDLGVNKALEGVPVDFLSTRKLVNLTYLPWGFELSLGQFWDEIRSWESLPEEERQQRAATTRRTTDSDIARELRVYPMQDPQLPPPAPRPRVEQAGDLVEPEPDECDPRGNLRAEPHPPRPDPATDGRDEFFDLIEWLNDVMQRHPEYRLSLGSDGRVTGVVVED